jgi:hypothetical protein
MNRTNILKFSLAIVLTTAIAPFVNGQTSPVATPTPRISDESETVIKVDTELVNMSVRVVDRFNRPIGNLKQGEFKVYEDNVLQQIEFSRSPKFRPTIRW